MISKLGQKAKQTIQIIAILITAVYSAEASPSEGYNKAMVKELIHAAESSNNIPKGLLFAIAKVESGHFPYQLGEEGRSIRAKSLYEAELVLQSKIKSGVKNIDIGVMQLNYQWHRKEFESLRDMLDPVQNIAYAAKLLSALKEKHGDWQTAIRYYHSYTAKHNRKYSRKVTMCWLQST